MARRRDGYGQTVSKWFRRYRQCCGVTEPKKVSHSYLHTIINHLKQTGFPTERIAACVGHEDDSMTFGRYGKPFEPVMMKTVVQALAFESITATITPSVGSAVAASKAARRKR